MKNNQIMISHSEIQRWQRINNLKQYFVDHCGLLNPYEVNKIWAHWIIRNQSLSDQDDEFIPTNQIEHDSGLTNNLIQNKGIEPGYIHQFYRDLCQLCRTTRPSESTTDQSVPLNLKQDGSFIQIEFQSDGIGGSYKLPQHIFQKMKQRYLGPPEKWLFHLWRTLTNYRILDGYGYQWGLSPTIFQMMEKMGINCELFASPLNCYFTKYYSLFPSDSAFGSEGNFFKIPKIQSGIYQVDPPFVDDVMTQSVNRIHDWLIKAQENQRDLTFIYLIPDWTDCQSFHELSQSTFLCHSVHLHKREHYYYDSWKQKPILANFDTYLFILNSLNQIPDLVQQYFPLILEHFRSKRCVQIG